VPKFELGPLQKKFLEALESGRYKQGTGYLSFKKSDGWQHCCLGVACETVGTRIVEIQHREGSEEAFFALRNYEGRASFLPSLVKDAMKFHDDAGTFVKWELIPEEQSEIEELPYHSLMHLNDHSEDFFKVIEIIKKFPHAIFSGPA
jgi:hypothetical protein